MKHIECIGGVGRVVGIVVPMLVGIAYVTLAERKVLGYVQGRRGPNVVGVYGLLQPLGDGLKLIGKAMVIPTTASGGRYVGAAVVTLMLAIGGYVIVPMGRGLVGSDQGLGLMYMLGVSSMGVYGVVIGG